LFTDILIINNIEYCDSTKLFLAFQKSEVTNKIVVAVMKGHRELAGKLVEEAFNCGGFGFNFLHKDVRK